MIRHRLIQLTAPIAAALILFLAVFAFFALSGSTLVAANSLNYDVDIGPNGQGKEVDQGDTITYTYFVTNTGALTDTYTVTATNESGWPTVVSSETITITSQISDTVVVTIEVDSDALAGPVITTITATSSSSILVSDFSTNTTDVKKEWGVAISPGETKEGLPNEVVRYTHTVTNTGNVSDTFTIGATPTNVAFLVEKSSSALDIDAYLTGTIVISVTVPGDALITDSSFVNVTATSSHPNTDATAQDTVNVKRVVDVRIENNESSSAFPGATVEYEHEVTNDGNGVDTFTFTAVSNKGYATTVPDPLELDPGESQNITVSIKILAGAAAGTIDKTTVTATSQEDSSKDDFVQDRTTINQIFGVKIVKNESSNALPGTTVVYKHTVTNKGNGNDTFDISVSSDQGYVVTRVPAVLNIDAGKSKKVEVSIDIPAGESAGVEDETTVTATSRGSGNPSDDVVDTTTVDEVLSVDIKKNKSGSADPGTTAVYTHTVTNQGNAAETFNISVSSNQGFVTRVIPTSLNLDQGEQDTVRVEIDISSTAVSDTDDKTTVTAASDTDANVKDSVIDTTTINKHRLFTPIVTSPSEWNQVGADSWADEDQATSIDVCPSDSDLIFAGTEDALRLFDGNSWTPITGDVPKGGVISSIVMNNTCDTVYVVVFKGRLDPIIPAHGVWEGALNNQGNWIWQELTGGVDVGLARKVVISDGTLFAAGGFGIAYWEDDAWIATTVVTGSGKPIMDLSVADGVNNSGPVYAVRWLWAKVFHNTNPGGNPGNWSEISGIADVPDFGRVRSVAGDDSNVRYLGTEINLYRLNGTNWELIKGQESRTILISGNVYAGFSGNPGDGVYISTDQGKNFSSYNAGWTVPDYIFVLVDNPDYLFAATSSGVFKR